MLNWLKKLFARKPKPVYRPLEWTKLDPSGVMHEAYVLWETNNKIKTTPQN